MPNSARSSVRATILAAGAQIRRLQEHVPRREPFAGSVDAI
jgi:hypothetical protein